MKPAAKAPPAGVFQPPQRRTAQENHPPPSPPRSTRYNVTLQEHNMNRQTLSVLIVITAVILMLGTMGCAERPIPKDSIFAETPWGTIVIPVKDEKSKEQGER